MFSHSPCSTDSKNIKISSEDPWEVLPLEWSFSGPKYKGNGHNFGFYFVLAITFKPLHLFPFRFHWRSTFFLFFAQTLISPILMTIVYQAIMVNIDKMAIMAIMAWLYMAMNMANIGVYSKTRKNVDQ